MWRDAGLIAGLGVGWGLNWPALKLALGEIPPWTMRAIGFTCAAILMFSAMRLRGVSVAIPRRHWGRLALVGALSVVTYNLLSAFAQLTASTSRSAVLSYTMPIWAVIFARLFLGEPFDTRRRLGLALGTAGLLALALPLVIRDELSWGLLFAVGSGVVWAAGSTALKRWPIDATPPVVTAWQIALGAIVTVCGALLLDPFPPRIPVRWETWAGLGYNIVVGQVFATTIWFTMLHRMPAGTAAIGSLIVPGIGVIGATLILGERPTLADWIGLALIVAASATVLLRPPPVPEATVPSSPRPTVP